MAFLVTFSMISYNCINKSHINRLSFTHLLMLVGWACMLVSCNSTQKAESSADFGIFTLKKIENSFYKNDAYYQNLKEIYQRRGNEKIDSLERFFPSNIGESSRENITYYTATTDKYVIEKNAPPYTHTYRLYKRLESKIRGRERDTLHLDFYFTKFMYKYDDGMEIKIDLTVHNNVMSLQRTSPCIYFIGTGAEAKWAGDWRYMPTGYNEVLAEDFQGTVITISVSTQKGHEQKEFVKTIRHPANCSGEIVDKIFEQRMITFLSNFDSKELHKHILK